MLLGLIIIFILLIIISLIILIGVIWTTLSNFYHKRYSFFEFIFIIIYLTEQLIFLLLYHLSKEYRVLWVSLIVLFVISTASIEKLMMNAKHKRLSASLYETMKEKEDLKSSFDRTKEEAKLQKEINGELMDFIEKNL